MSHQKGFEVTCDRCGVKAFVSDDHPSLTLPVPENWRNFHELNGQLCPFCTHQWDAAKKAFLACEDLTIFPPTKTHKEET